MTSLQYVDKMTESIQNNHILYNYLNRPISTVQQ